MKHLQIISTLLLFTLTLTSCKNKDKTPHNPQAQAPTQVTPAASRPPTPPQDEDERPSTNDTDAAHTSRFDQALALPTIELAKLVWKSIGHHPVSCHSSLYYNSYIFYAVNSGDRPKTVPWIACLASKGIPSRAQIIPGDGLLELLEKISNKRIYLKGPHQDDYGVARLTRGNGHNEPPFGHYNPSFVRWFIDNAIPGVKDETFRQETQAIYDNYFRAVARIYDDSYKKIKKNPSCFKKQRGAYEESMKAKQLHAFNYEPWDHWLAEPNICNRKPRYREGDRVEQLPYHVIIHPEGMAFSFWVRRDIDGTSELWYEGLQKLRSTYEREATHKP